MNLPATNHARPWALVKRGGIEIGKRPKTRMAYLIGTVAPNGRAVALTGHVMNDDLSGWSKTVRRIEWSDVVADWRYAPDATLIKKAKKKLAVVAAPSA